jgi:L-rhamnose mutarotase
LTHVCFTLQVDPAKLDAYREAHAAVWPEMLEALAATGWRDYRLFLRSEVCWSARCGPTTSPRRGRRWRAPR